MADGMSVGIASHKPTSGQRRRSPPENLYVWLDVDVLVDDNLSFAATFCHHLQKTCAELAFRVELKTGRHAALKPRNPRQGLAHGNVTCEEPQRHNLELQHRAAEWSLENDLVPVTECLPPGKKHSHNVCKGPISSEMLGVSISVAVVPGGDLVIKDPMNGVLIRLRLRSSDYSGQQHDDHCYGFHTRLLAQECWKVYTLVHLSVWLAARKFKR